MLHLDNLKILRKKSFYTYTYINSLNMDMSNKNCLYLKSHFRRYDKMHIKQCKVQLRVVNLFNGHLSNQKKTMRWLHRCLRQKTTFASSINCVSKIFMHTWRKYFYLYYISNDDHDDEEWQRYRIISNMVSFQKHYLLCWFINDERNSVRCEA